MKPSLYLETETPKAWVNVSAVEQLSPLKGHRLQFQHIVGQPARNQSSISVQHNTTLLHLSGQH